MKAYLMLENGCCYEGITAGKFKETVCEIVFNTAMTGYVELFSEPTYAGQGVVMSYPMIGNYGVNKEDFQSDRLYPSALLVHELCDTPSNFRNEMTINELLNEYCIPCVTNLDTRAIVKNLRDNGTMNGIITTNIDDKESLLNKIKAYKGNNLVQMVTRKEKLSINDGKDTKIAIIDTGVKKSIIDAFTERNCTIALYPANAMADEILKDSPNGIVIPNGPGNPNNYEDIIKEVKVLMDKDIAIMGIGLGHEILALANGGKVEKMKYGHRGVSQPVKEIKTDNTYLSAQACGYTVSNDGMPHNAEISWVNVNDGTIEGIEYNNGKAFSVHFHPETKVGPRNTSYLYDKFLDIVREGR